MSDDTQFIVLLDTLAKQAQPDFERMAALSGGDAASNARLHAAAESLKEAMEARSEFSPQYNIFFCGKQLVLDTNFQSMNLLREAVHRGGADALSWYRNVRATRRTPIRIMAEVRGLKITAPHSFSNGVTLHPISEAPGSYRPTRFNNLSASSFEELVLTVASFDVGDVDAGDSEAGHAEYARISELMRRTVSACVLGGETSPTLTTTWLEFVDPELQRAEFGFVSMMSKHEGRHAQFPADATPETIAWVEKYVNLPQEVAEHCDVAIERLNLARRRMKPGDQAIDGCICLEALLSGKGGQSELTHRVSLRTALLLGRTLQDRQDIYERVKRFYTLRSKMVHGQVRSAKNTDGQIATDGLSLCLDALRAIIEGGAKPQPEEWELAGGPPQNRYTGNSGLQSGPEGG